MEVNISNELVVFFQSQGIIHQTSCTNNTPQQNGVVERRNRQLLEVTRALLLEKNVPKYLWGDALLSAMYVINRVPSSVLAFQTPLQILTAKIQDMPSISNLPPKVFGCVAYAHILSSTWQIITSGYQMCFCRIWFSSETILLLSPTYSKNVCHYGCYI